VIAADAGPMEIEWEEDSNVECLRNCAVEHGRRRRERTRQESIVEEGPRKLRMEFLFCVKAQRDRAR